MDYYKQKDAKKKFLMIIITYILALAVLIIYAILGYTYTIKSEEYLCPITAVAVVTTDLVLFLLMKYKMTSGPLQLTIMLIGFRAFLFGFGGDYWFLGYCSLYIFFGVYVSVLQIDSLYPFYEIPIKKV